MAIPSHGGYGRRNARELNSFPRIAGQERPALQDKSQARRIMEPRIGWKSNSEELANAVTHGIGLVLSVLGAVGLMALALRNQDPWRIAGCSIFVIHLMVVYAMSTLSHCFSADPWRSFFRSLDQGCIYLLIAATYTPFSFAYLRTPLGWLLLGVIWGIALHGFVSKVVYSHRVNSVSVWPCIVLGWLPVLSLPALISRMPAAAMGWMLVGGLCYTVGTAYLVHDNKRRHYHATWHIFVIAGSACHFLAILLLVA